MQEALKNQTSFCKSCEKVYENFKVDEISAKVAELVSLPKRKQMSKLFQV